MRRTELDGSDRVWLRRSPWRDGLSVAGQALRLLGRHWPALLALSFAGAAARNLAEYAAVRLSVVNNYLGAAAFILVPIVTMSAMVLMIWLVRSSLPAVSAMTGTVRLGVRGIVEKVGKAVLPLIAVYVALGYLWADVTAYSSDALSYQPSHALATVPSGFTAASISVAVVAFGLRALLGRLPWAQRHGAVFFVRAYLEVAWIAIGATALGTMTDWLGTRRIWHWGHDEVTRLDGLGDPVRHLVDGLGLLLGSAGTVIVVPVAWIAVGAIIFGSTTEDDEHVWNVAAARRLVRLPKPVRLAVRLIREQVAERFSELRDAFRLILRTGLVAMLVFCVLFVLTGTLATWLFVADRDLIGPHNLATVWMPLSEPLSVLNDAVALVPLMCLVAAAADRVLGSRAAEATPGAAERAPIVAAVDEPTVVLPVVPSPRDAADDVIPSSV